MNDLRKVQNVKLVVCDVDGTLFNHRHKLSEFTAEVVRKLVAKGYHFAIASGRNIHDVQTIMGEIGVTGYCIGSNGAVVTAPDGKMVQSLVLDKDVLDELISIPKVEGVHVNMYQGKKWFVDEEEKVFMPFYQEGYLLPQIANLEEYAREKTDKFFFTTLESKKLDPILDYIRKRIKDRAFFTFSMSRCLEVMNKNANKGNALRVVAGHLGLDSSQIMAFGNGENDKEMLEMAGIAYLMGNTRKNVISMIPRAKIIKNNAQDGVALKLIEDFGL